MHHHAEIRWRRRADEAFVDRRYGRAHTWHFDGGAAVPASSSPHVVPPPCSVAEHVDPEEALVAAVASCHMLTFLFLAAQQRLVVERYDDAATGEVGRDAQGRDAVVGVTLRPSVAFAGALAPDDATVRALHDAAHARCVIASSIRATVAVEGSWTHAGDDAAGDDAAGDDAARATGGTPA